jgi:hypothetical protein
VVHVTKLILLAGVILASLAVAVPVSAQVDPYNHTSIQVPTDRVKMGRSAIIVVPSNYSRVTAAWVYKGDQSSAGARQIGPGRYSLPLKDDERHPLVPGLVRLEIGTIVSHPDGSDAQHIRMVSVGTVR